MSTALAQPWLQVPGLAHRLPFSSAAGDLFVVGAVAVGDADVLPERGLERGVELVERGRGAAFELQRRRGRDRAQRRRGDRPFW